MKQMSYLCAHIQAHTTQVIFELIEAPVGRSNVLHGLLEFAKLLIIV